MDIPSKILENPHTKEFLSQVSYAMTQITDKFTGVGLAMQAEVSGTKAGQRAKAIATISMKIPRSQPGQEPAVSPNRS